MSTFKPATRLVLVVAMSVGLIGGGAAGMSLLGTTAAQAAPPAAATAPAANGVSQPNFADIFERVSPAVVNISVTEKAAVRPMGGFPGQPGAPLGPEEFQDFFGHFFGFPQGPMNGVPARALGSGLIIDGDGYVVTNNHVIDGAESITVTLVDGRELEATLIGTDPKTDIALLKVTSDAPLDAVTLGNSDAARVGDWVLAIGNPFGLGGTATFGIISALGRDIQSGPYDDYLQIDAPINSGNSGGPVFNVNGEVIGVNTAIYSPNGGNVGIGFAIPSAMVRTIVDDLKADGHVTRGWLGVQIQDIDEDLASSLGMHAKDGGALIADVVPDSPAAKAELQVGDVITSFDGKKVDSPKALSRLVADAGPDDKARLTVLRDGRTKNVTVKLSQAEDEEVLASNGPNEHGGELSDKLGLTVQPLNAMIRQQLGLEDDVNGLVVTGVDPRSDAAQKGLRRGDVIVSADGKEIDSLAALDSQLKKAEADDRNVRILVRRGDGQRFVALGLS